MNFAEHRFFHGIRPEDAARLQAIAEHCTANAGQLVFAEGDAPDGVYLVLNGRVELVKHMSGPHVRVLAVAEAGDYFGEMGTLDGSLRSTDAVASEPTTLVRIPRDQFVDILNSAPGYTAMSFMHQVLDHLREMNERFVSEVVRKEKMTLVGEMANTIIHDIRGPFTSVQLGTDLIMEQHQDTDTKEICEMMKGQINRVKVMAEELLEYARGTSKIRLEEVDLTDLINQFCFLNKDFIASTNVTISLELQPGRILADPNKLMRVLQNIVNNAVEALRNLPEGVVRIETTFDDHHARILVADNGPGIPEEIRERVFEPFVTHGKKNGTGLGMAIARSVMQAHNGSITFETATGRGTTFVLTIPRFQENVETSAA